MGGSGIGPTPAELKQIRRHRLKHFSNMRERRAKQHFRRSRQSTQDLMQQVTDVLVDEADIERAHSTYFYACVTQFPGFDAAAVTAYMHSCGLDGEAKAPEKPLTQDDETPPEGSCTGCASNPRCGLVAFTVRDADS
jgi:hypothetical protein